MASTETIDRTTAPDRNEVFLTGRLSAPPEAKMLPSGQQLTLFRLIVRRSPEAAAMSRPGGRGQSVDVVECTVWHDWLAASLADATPGDTLAVRGSLRRRFTRTDHGPSSWCNVEVTHVERRRASDQSP